LRDPERILLLRLSAIGDVVLTSPLIRALRQRFPNARIDFVIKESFAELMAHNPRLDSVYRFDPASGVPGLVQLGQQLRRQRYDVVLDLHRNFRTIILTRLCAAPRSGHYHKHVLRRWLFVKFKAATVQRIPPVAQRYLQAAAFLNLPNDGANPELFWSAAHEAEALRALLQAGWKKERALLCLAPGAGYFTKRWPIEYFSEVARELAGSHKNFALAILGGEQDCELGRYLREHSRAEILDLTGKCSLLASAAIIKRSRLVLANDSGLMHIAEAVGTPVLALFGSTTRELGFFPQRATSRVLEQLNLDCRPCSHLGYHACPARHFRCMKEITPQRVLDEIDTALLARAE
jgi:heptosyltransferase-2